MVLLGVAALAGCTSTTAVSSEPGDDVPGVSAATATADAQATVAASTTTAAPSTTAAPTTTEAPTTTAAPTTLPPLPPLPSRVQKVKAMRRPLAAVGSQSGEETSRVQQRLLDLGFWLEGVDGSYGLTTSQAVMAFQKYVGLPTTGSVDEATAAFMSNLTRRAHGRADAGTIIEIDKARQLIFFVVDGKTRFVFNTSTGNGEKYTEPDQNSPGEMIEGVSLTPDGLHYVERQREEGWWEGDLGQIYRPKYFVGGVAIHGSNSVPDYPASHGCVRVTVQAMDFIWASDLMPLNTPVWVHGHEPKA